MMNSYLFSVASRTTLSAFWLLSMGLHLWASNCRRRSSVASLTLRRADGGALKFRLQCVQTASQGYAPRCFTIRTARLGMNPV
jgi:hypothetical protein